MTRLRFGVVGCGAISTVFQLPALRRSPAVTLAAVTDVDDAWAAQVARRFHVPAHFGDHRALVGRVDAALIATPNTTHADIACDLLAHGIHVLCEKPAAARAADARRMIDAAKAGGARLMIAHCLRFSPNFALMKRLIERGWIGAVKEVTAAIGGPYEDGAQRTDFRRQRRLSGGGVLLDLGIHVIDLALWMLGEQPSRVAYDASSPDGWEVESDAEVALDFPGAARATLAASFTRPLANTVRVGGDAGWIEASLYNPAALTFFTNRARMCHHDGMQTILTDAASMYDEQITHFCAQIASGGDFVVRPVEVLRALAVVDACYGAAA